VDNLSDEYGKYLGHAEIEPSHALLYRRVLNKLGVPVRDGTMTTPAQQSSKAAADFYQWFREKVATESPDYLLGHFLAYEITDVLDFPDYATAALRMWPGDTAIHEFFIQHAESDHDSAFARDLQSFFEENREAMISAMGKLLEQWTVFYQRASEEVQQ
ncbi:MAG: iron-containing redox enzyme family protein, partial [Patescibacteria group bacterium]